MLATCATFMLNLLSLVHTFFLFINVLIKYIGIYYSSILETVEDNRVIKMTWIFIMTSSVGCLAMEYTFIHDIQSMNIYNILQHNLSEPQVARIFVNLIFMLTVIMYIYLQIKIKIDLQTANNDFFFDFVTSLGYISFYVVYFNAVIFEPIIENIVIRVILQWSLVDFFLLRLIWKCHNLRDRITHFFQWSFCTSLPNFIILCVLYCFKIVKYRIEINIEFCIQSDKMASTNMKKHLEKNAITKTNFLEFVEPSVFLTTRSFSHPENKCRKFLHSATKQ